MNRNLIFAVLAAMTLSFSCAKENEGDLNPDGQAPGYVTLTFTAGSESTKTTLGDPVDGLRAISWEEGDEIKIVYGEGATDYVTAKAKSSGSRTVFTFSVPQGATTLYAVYPSDAFQGLSEGKVTVNIPSVQDGAFRNANIAVAKTTVSEQNLFFRNVVSYVLTDITDENVKGVRLEASGLALAGNVPVSFNEDGDVEVGTVADASDNVYASVSGPGTCCLALAAGVSFDSGVRVVFSDIDGVLLSDLMLQKQDFILRRGSVYDGGRLDTTTMISYYASPSGSGTKDGLSSANAWSVTELMEWLATENPEIPVDKTEEAPFNISLAAGTYTIPSATTIPTKGRELNIVSSDGKAVIDGSVVSGNKLLNVTATGNINIKGVTFSNHTGTGTGEVMLWFRHSTENAQTVRLDNCTFSCNTNAGVGGALVLYNSSDNYLTDCTFTGNVAGGGSALNIDGEKTKVTMAGCTFSGNKCVSYSNIQNSGAAIKIGNGTVTASDCEFLDNEIAIASGAGAAVWVANCVKTTFKEECLFKGNTSIGNGGAVFVTGGASVEFDDCDFQKNTAAFGGAVALGGVGKHTEREFSVTFKNGCTFTENYSADGGGAIVVTATAAGTFSTDGCTFSGNNITGTSGGSGGGAIRVDQIAGKKVTLTNTVFTSNKAYRHGGAVAVYNDMDLDVNGCTFKGNTLTAGRGGAIYVGGQGDCENNVHIYGNTVFTSNSAVDSGGAVAITNDGNALSSDDVNYNTSRTTVTIENTTFNQNYSKARGGALDTKTSGIVNVSNCVFYQNYTTDASSDGCGAGVNLEYGNTVDKYPGLRGLVNISDCRFEGNYTTVPTDGFDPRGGAVSIPSAGDSRENYIDVRIDRCSFKDNRARQAGAIRCWTGKKADASLFINSCSFEGNHSYANNGLCIFIYDSKEFGMNNCSFRNNYGSAQSVSRLSWINICRTPTIFSNNTIVGQLQKSNGDTADYASGGGLIRFEGEGATYDFINNLIASPKGWCAALLDGDAKVRTVNTYSNKFTSHAVAVDDEDAFNGANWLGLNTYFGSLAWIASITAAQEYKSGWTWNGTLAIGTPVSKNTLEDVNAKIQAANADFYTWLGTVGGLDKDQQGNARGAETWPGAYQGE